MKTQILVVEDNPADVDLLRRALADAAVECELTVVEDGAEALALIGKIEKRDAAVPELLILDLNLPKHGGLEVLETLRATVTMAEMPVVVLTSSASPRERASIERLNVRRHIVKPPDLDEFMKIGLELRAVLQENKSRGQSAG